MKFLTRKKSILTSILVVLCIGITFSFSSSIPSGAVTTWTKIGDGHLNVTKEGNDYLLYPSPATYFKKGNNPKGKQFYVKTKKAYQLQIVKDKLITKPVSVDETSVEQSNMEMPLLKVNQKLFNTHREKTLRTASGNVLSDDESFSNLWKIDDQSNLTPILNETQLEKTKKEVDKLNAIATKHGGEQKLNLVAASEPHLLNKGKQVAFTSNKNHILEGTDETSIYVMNEDGSNEKLLVDAKKYGYQKIVGVGEKKVISLNPKKFNLLVSDMDTQAVKEHEIQGWAETVSPNGKYAVFRKVDDSSILPELYVYNIENQQQLPVTGMPADYFYNSGGEWSEDGRYFAFIANGVNQINKKNKLYRDNNLLVVLDTANMNITSLGKPQESASIYPSASISWIDMNHILTYADDDTSWIASINRK